MAYRLPSGGSKKLVFTSSANLIRGIGYNNEIRRGDGDRVNDNSPTRCLRLHPRAADRRSRGASRKSAVLSPCSQRSKRYNVCLTTWARCLRPPRPEGGKQSTRAGPRGGIRAKRRGQRGGTQPGAGRTRVTEVVPSAPPPHVSARQRSSFQSTH